jgi:predicted RNase H-like nuclease (RuvC/YqgF family)
MSDTPRTDEQEYYYSNHDSCAGESLYRVIDDKDVTWDDQYSGFSVTSNFARQLERELAEAQNILKQCLSIMPVGYVPTHTAENLPEMIGDLAKALAEETTEREKLERELSDMTKRRDELLASLEKVVAYLSPPPSGD